MQVPAIRFAGAVHIQEKGIVLTAHHPRVNVPKVSSDAERKVGSISCTEHTNKEVLARVRKCRGIRGGKR